MSPEKSPVGWFKMSVYNFLVSGPKFTNLSSSNRGGNVVDQVLSDFRYVDPFVRYSRSKLKVVPNRAEFWTFFALPNFVSK